MEYSVVIPVYNSEQSLEELNTLITKTLQKITPSFEIIYVDDYSKDNSWQTLLKIKEESTFKIRLFQLAKNFGQHNATLCGFHQANGNYVITLDDDLQHSPEDIPLLIQKMEDSNVDLVYGVSNEALKLKKIGSEVYKKSSKIIEGSIGKGSSFRLIKASLVKRLIEHDHFSPYIEEVLYWYTHSIAFVPTTFKERKFGVSNYKSKNLFNMVKNNSLGYSIWPLRLMMFFGGVLSLIFFLIGIYYIIKKILLNVSVPGFTALIVSICFTASIMLLCFGILGFYIKNILSRFNNKPMYYIKETK